MKHTIGAVRTWTKTDCSKTIKTGKKNSSSWVTHHDLILSALLCGNSPLCLFLPLPAYLYQYFSRNCALFGPAKHSQRGFFVSVCVAGARGDVAARTGEGWRQRLGLCGVFFVGLELPRGEKL